MKISNAIRTTAVAAALGLAVAAPAFAADAVCTMATSDNVYLRAGEGTNYDKLGVVPKGAKVEVFGMSAEGWYHVKYNNQYGFLWYRYVDFEGDASNDVHDGGTTYMYPTTALNVRSEPNTNCGVLGTLAKDEAVAVTAKNNGWFTVEYKGMTGYCFGKYLGFTQGGYTVAEDQAGNTAGRNVMNQGNTAGADPEDTAGRNVMNQNNDDAGDTAGKNVMNENNGSGTSTMNNLHVISNTGANVRAYPSTSAARIGGLAKGATVDIIAEEGNWYEIQYGNEIGYIYAPLCG